MELLKDLDGSKGIVQLRDSIVHNEKRSIRSYMSYAGHGDLEKVREKYPAVILPFRLGGTRAPIKRTTARGVVKKTAPVKKAAGTAARTRRFVPEAAIWSIFEQLSEACILMEYGTIDDDDRKDDWQQIVHRGKLSTFRTPTVADRKCQTSSPRMYSSMPRRTGHHIPEQFL